MRTQPSHSTPARRGFTLLELMIAIVIIGTLIALLFPALRSIFDTAETVEVSAEMTKLDQALQAFRTRFGEYPPSSLTFPVPGGTWSSRDRAKIRAIWPEFNFATNGGLNPPNAAEVNLNGAECLVFFLGGVQSGTADEPVLQGFSKDPREPWVASENTDGPFMEFDLGRMTNVDSASGDTAFEYLDPLPDQTTPYLYISAAGKRMNRDNGAGADDYDVFGDRDAGGYGNGTQQDMSFCYMQADGRTAHRKDSFQLISPGADTLYGTGGVYTDSTTLDDTDLDTSGDINNADDTTNGITTGVFDPLDHVERRGAEADNITNFSNGLLNVD